MDESDTTRIFYNQVGIYHDGEQFQSEVGNLDVKGKGKGTSSQEPQLKASLGKGGYFRHYWSQKFHEKQK